jgi:hypothetical protein
MSDTIIAIKRNYIINLEIKMFPATSTFSLWRIEDHLGIAYVSASRIDEKIISPEDVFHYKIEDKEKFVFAVMKYNIDYITIKNKC